MTIEEMIERKWELGCTNEQISELSGVPLGTVQKIFSGLTRTPRYATLEALRAVFEDGGPTPGAFDEGDAGGRPLTWEELCERLTGERGTGLRERTLPGRLASPDIRRILQKSPGTYTAADMEAIPASARLELIGGYFYDLACPSIRHRQLCERITSALAALIAGSDVSDRLLTAPARVSLGTDEQTVLVPDVCVIPAASGEKPAEHVGTVGAPAAISQYPEMTHDRISLPSLLIEVLSPRTRKKDLTIKRTTCRAAGVQEYWIVDPANDRIYISRLSEGDDARIYRLTEDIPVSIGGGNRTLSLRRKYRD